jgi:hypothetical protein
MGVWNTGLYSSDFALDLRSAIAAVVRLPLDAGQLVDALCELEPSAAAHRVDDEDHTTFWLVVADQFAKRNIVADRARDAALAIIDSGMDLDMHAKRGMGEPDLAKRRKVLQDVRARVLATQQSNKSRPVLKNPQPYLMEVGDVFAYPTAKGRPINPYITPGKGRSGGPLAWSQDGWSAFVVVGRGRAFGFLAWYRPMTIATAVADRPTLSALDGEPLWIFRLAGTCSAVHFKRMRLEHIGRLPVDSAKLKRAFPEMRPSHSRAIGDISISNELSVGPSVHSFVLAPPGEPANARKGRLPTMSDIQQILVDRDLPESRA